MFVSKEHTNQQKGKCTMKKLYQLNIDEVLSNLSLSTDYDIGGEGHCIVVEKAHIDVAIDEIVHNFENLIVNSFERYEEEEDN
jgi:hypothetical protein